MSKRAVSAIRDLMVLGGAGLVAYGAGLAWRPAGFMVAGALLAAAGVVGALREQRPREGEDG